jgi:DNA replication protein DnaC
MATVNTAQEVQDRRHEQAGMVTERTIHATRKLPNNVADEIMARVKSLGLAKDDEYLPCGQRTDYQYCPAVDRLEDVAKELELIRHQKEHPEEILSIWNVPKKHLCSSFESFDGGEAAKLICSEASKHLESVLLTGPTGCGKTHLAVAMLRQKIKNSDVELEPGHCYQDKTKTLFVTVPELLLEIRQTFNNPNLSEAKVVDKYSNVSLLVLDDLGAEKTTDWSESALYIIIDRRNREEMWTIVTSNLELKDIERYLGARIASRLSDMKIINLKLPDYRKKRKAGLNG